MAPTALDIITSIATSASALIAALALLIAIIAQRQSQAAQRDLQRPILVLAEEQSHLIMSGSSGLVDAETNNQNITLINVGAGTAVRIQGVLFRYEMDDQWAADRRLSLDLYKLLAPNQSYSDHFTPGKTVVRGGSMIVGPWKVAFWTRAKYTLWVPRELADPRRLLEDMPRNIARLTLTYHDVYGRKHATIYDYSELLAWQPVAFLENISLDIGELDARDRKERHPPTAIGANHESIRSDL